MDTLTTTASWLVRVTGMVQVILGLTFWTGRALALVPLHMAIGLAFVLGVWMLAALAAKARTGIALAAFALLWGVVVLALGMRQGTLLPGRAHWIVQALHLAAGIAAMALASRLATRIRERGGARARPPRSLAAGDDSLTAT
jgi:hypothetical protein